VAFFFFFFFFLSVKWLLFFLFPSSLLLVAKFARSCQIRWLKNYALRYFEEVQTPKKHRQCSLLKMLGDSDRRDT